MRYNAHGHLVLTLVLKIVMLKYLYFFFVDAPVCNLVISEGDDCTEVTLICECDAVPDITRYFLFNGSSLINDGTIETFTKSVAYGTSTEFSCSATNYIGPGDKSDVKVHVCEGESSKNILQLPCALKLSSWRWGNFFY